jgi:hypothetical protein
VVDLIDHYRLPTNYLSQSTTKLFTVAGSRRMPAMAMQKPRYPSRMMPAASPQSTKQDTLKEIRIKQDFMQEGINEIKDTLKTMAATQVAQGLELKNVELRFNTKIENATRKSDIVITGVFHS